MLPVLVGVVLVFGVVRPFVVEPFYVPTGSMAPTLVAGDHLLVAKFTLQIGEPDRGDIVVLEDPQNDEGHLVKRVVALGGHTVEIRDGVLVVNGRPLHEPYVDYRLTDQHYYGPVLVPAEHVFVLGDNRANSIDFRVFGPVHESRLVGEVALTLR